jgi:putative endonuclease
VDKVYCVYILTNQRNTVLYTGVTGDLGARVHQHREKLLAGFTNRKAGSRQKKIDLIKWFNPEWRDLYDDL